MMVRAAGPTEMGRNDAKARLEDAGGQVKTALAIHARRLDRPAAEAMTKEAAGHLGRTIASAEAIE